MTEAHNHAQELFGDERLKSAVVSHMAESALYIQQHLLDAVTLFVDGAPRFDDMACIAVKRVLGEG